MPYRTVRGNSGVSAYIIGSDYIIVEFRHDGAYLYTFDQPGREHVEAMQQLAQDREGLATYINRHVRENYAKKLR